MRQPRDTIALFFAVIALLIAFGCGDGSVVGLDDNAEPPDALSGRAILQNQEDHYGITIEIRSDDWSQTFVTDSDGYFTFPSELNSGTWTVEARYPFYSTVSTQFEVRDGVATEDLQELVLAQDVTFQTQTVLDELLPGLPLAVVLFVSNNSDHEISLKSATSPMFTVAVRQNQLPIVGSLFPGDDKAEDEIVIGPGEVRTFTEELILESLALEPGIYQVYSLLAASESYPDYFDESAPELNDTLYGKLVPAEIQIPF